MGGDWAVGAVVVSSFYICKDSTGGSKNGDKKVSGVLFGADGTVLDSETVAHFFCDTNGASLWKRRVAT